MATIRKNKMVTNAEENVKKESFYTPLTELLSGAATLQINLEVPKNKILNCHFIKL